MYTVCKKNKCRHIHVYGVSVCISASCTWCVYHYAELHGTSIISRYALHTHDIYTYNDISAVYMYTTGMYYMYLLIWIIIMQKSICIFRAEECGNRLNVWTLTYIWHDEYTYVYISALVWIIMQGSIWSESSNPFFWIFEIWTLRRPGGGVCGAITRHHWGRPETGD